MYLESKAKPFKRGFEMRRVIDKNRRLSKWFRLFEFPQKRHRSFGGSCQIQPYMQEFVGFGIDSSVQPKSLIIELNHGFDNRDVMWILAVDGL